MRSGISDDLYIQYLLRTHLLELIHIMELPSVYIYDRTALSKHLQLIAIGHHSRDLAQHLQNCTGTSKHCSLNFSHHGSCCHSGLYHHSGRDRSFQHGRAFLQYDLHVFRRSKIHGFIAKHGHHKDSVLIGLNAVSTRLIGNGTADDSGVRL